MESHASPLQTLCVYHCSSAGLTAYQVSNNLDLIAALVWSLINVLLWSLPLCYSIFLVPSPAPASKGRGGIGIYSLICAFCSLLLLWGFAILILALGQGIGTVCLTLRDMKVLLRH